MNQSIFVIFLILIFKNHLHVVADESTQQYEKDESVTLWVNKVGPYHNPQETYKYFSLPYCRSPAQQHIRLKDDEGLGAALEGNELEDSGVSIHFLQNVNKQEICKMTLNEDTAKEFSDAVFNHYWYQLYLDELPIFGMVGQMMVPQTNNNNNNNNNLDAQPDAQPFLFTHKSFSIAYNGNQIIELNLTSDDPVQIRGDTTVTFTYSVNWIATDASFDDRFDRYLDFNFFEHQIHWFSIFNSFMMVIFLCGLVVLILMRTLRNDYNRYMTDDDELDLDRVIDESGWKQVHGDVFRPPAQLMLFSCCVGTGYQLFFLVFLCIGLAISRSLYMGRGRILGTFVTMYSLTSFIAGYASGSYYKRNGGNDWKRTMIVTLLMFPGICFGIVFMLNFIAIGYQTLQAMSLSTMIQMVAMWCFLSAPLGVVGTVVGRKMTAKDDFPCRVNSIRRPIPDGRWYTSPTVLSLAGGVLPFGSIFIEMYFIFTSFWNYKFYYVYGFMLLVYVILIIVTMCVTIVSTYCLLNAEDYRWQWVCFLSGGSTSLYVFLYAIYYFFTKTRMYGFFQTCFYFGYMAIFSFGLFFLCGAIGFMGTDLFVRRIYQYIKSD